MPDGKDYDVNMDKGMRDLKEQVMKLLEDTKNVNEEIHNNPPKDFQGVLTAMIVVCYEYDRLAEQYEGIKPQPDMQMALLRFISALEIPIASNIKKAIDTLWYASQQAGLRYEGEEPPDLSYLPPL